MSGATVVVMGYVVRGPLGGMAWSDLQYVASLRAAGHRVIYVEDSDDYASCYDPRTDETTTDPAYGLSFAADALAGAGAGDAWCYYDAHRDTWHGPVAERGPRVFEDADVLLNLAAVNPLRDWALGVPVRVLVDQDPAFTQVRNVTDPERAAFTRSHNAWATFATSIGLPDSAVPDDGIEWEPTRQPVLVDRFPADEGPSDGSFTSVMQWASYPGVELGGTRYGMKSDSFEALIDLPARTHERLELAVGAPGPVRARLEAAGWATRDPRPVTRTPAAYEAYIRASKGELGVAKHGYVVSRSGWFSERSLAYMAQARPVVLQDTGFSQWLPTGDGVLAFTTVDDAAAALDEVARDYTRHCAAARAVAAEHFDGRRVVTELLDSALTAAAAPAP